jgi:hypothetical protein
LRLTLPQPDDGSQRLNGNQVSGPEVLMTGRRSHPRYAVATPWDGAIRVLKEVVVHRTERDELHALSQVAAVAGEEMTLDLIGAGATLGLRVRVIDSRPVMVEGAVRHCVRLTVLNGTSALMQAGDLLPDAVVRAASPAEAL